MAAADAFGRVMLELMEHVLSSSSESRSQENIEKILPMFRTRTPLFYNLSTGKNFNVQARSRGRGRGGLEPPQKFSDLNHCCKSGIFLLKWTAVNGI